MNYDHAHSRQRRGPLVTAALAALAASTLGAFPAQATDSVGFSAVQQWKGNTGDIDLKTKTPSFDLKLKTQGEADFYITRNSIAGGGTSGWHTHPGPSLITVTVGAILAYEAALCTSTRYEAGETFLDEGGDHVHMLQNASGTDAAETVAVQFVAAGATRRIDAPEPSSCSF